MLRERRKESQMQTLLQDLRFGARALARNKAFTAVAVLQLIEAGRLSLDGLVGQYLANYPNTDVASR